jgi:hypothetical protein
MTYPIDLLGRPPAQKQQEDADVQVVPGVHGEILDDSRMIIDCHSSQAPDQTNYLRSFRVSVSRPPWVKQEAKE